MESNITLNYDGLRRDSPLALYYQLKLIIKSKIENNEWLPGTKAPSEADLAEQYGVSRLTARQAVQELVRDGWLYRQAGIGTFVADHRIQQRLSKLTSFTEDQLERNMVPGARLISTRLTEPNDELIAVLGLGRNQLVMEIIRVRLANGNPLAYEKLYLPQFLAPDLASQDLTKSITTLLENRYGLKCPYAEQRIRADNCTTEASRFLEIRPRAVVLAMERVYYREQGKPAYWVVSIYQANKYEIILTLQR